jgi:hypothetical protein
MINKHLTDSEVQQYVSQKANAGTAITEHIKHCADCKIKVEQYRLLFDGIKEQEKPVLDFNLADLVMAQLPVSEPAVANSNTFFYVIAFITIFIIGALCYIFGNNLLDLFGGITPILTGLIITTVTSVLIFLCIDMYKNYQTKMQSLNFY